MSDKLKRPLKVFLCHAHVDREPVRKLYSRLVEDGVDAWFDKEKHLPGQDWELEIRKAVRESDVVLVCLSKNFNQRGFRQKEVRLALDTAMEMPDGEIFIIPAKLEECDNLESLGKWQWVDLFEKQGYERLIGSLSNRAKKIRGKLPSKTITPKSSIKRVKSKKNAPRAKQKNKNAITQSVKNGSTSIAGNVENSPVVAGEGNTLGNHNVVTNTGNNSVAIVTVNSPNANVKPQINIKRSLRPQNATPPEALPNFVGRKDLLSEIKLFFKGKQSKTIAIIGMGGSGKTSLILQAVNHQPRFKRNVFYSELRKGTEDEVASILNTWAELCGQELPSRSAPLESANITRGLLERRGKKKPILIIIDGLRDAWHENEETLFSAIPSNASVILATREVEIAQKLAPDSKIFNLDEDHPFSDSDAQRLLIDHSKNKISESESVTIAELCGNMPLALELISKSAEKKDADVKGLIEKLTDKNKRLGALENRIAHKNQNVRMSIEISYETLTAFEKTAFRYLGVFESVMITAAHFGKALDFACENIDAQKTLQNLRGCSLLRYDSQRKSYQMHNLVHDFSRNLLVSQESSKARQGHFACFQEVAQSYAGVDLMERDNERVKEFGAFYPQMEQALENFGTEYKDSRLNNEQLKTVFSLIDALDKRWVLYDEYKLQAKWLEVGYDVARKIKNPLKQADFACRIGRAYDMLDKSKEGLKWVKTCEIALASNRNKEAKLIRARAYIWRASLNPSSKTAEQDCQRGIELATEKKHPEICAEGHLVLGRVYLEQDNLSRAKEAFEQSFTLGQKNKDENLTRRAGANVRAVLYFLGDIASLRDAEAENLRYWEQYPGGMNHVQALINLGLIRDMDGEYDEANKLFELAIKISDERAYTRLRIESRVDLAWTYLATQKYKEAKILLDESLKLQKEHEIADFESNTKACMAKLLIETGSHSQAIEMAQEAVNLAKADESELDEGVALCELGRAYHLSGNQKRALTYLNQSLSLLRENEHKYNAYLTLEELVKFYSDVKDDKRAQAVSAEAKRLADEMGIKR